MKRLSKNLITLLGADLVRRVAGFITVAYLARVLGVDRFGIVTIGWTALAYGLAVSAAGLPTLAVRRIAAGEGDEIIPGILGSRIATAVLVFLVTVVIALVAIHDRITAAVVGVMAMSVLAQAFWVDWYFQGREALAPVALARTVSAFVYLAAVLLFVHGPRDLLWVGGGAVMGDVFAADVMIRFLRKRGVAVRVDLHPATVVRLLRESLPLTVGGILAYLSINFPPLVLAILATQARVGVYGAASKLVFFLLVGDRILSTLLLPASARLHAKSSDLLAGTLRQALRWVLVVALPVAVGGMILAEPIVRLVFGSAYSASAGVLRLFIWYFLLTMVHTVGTTGVIAVGRERAYGRIMMITAVLYAVSVSVGVWFFQEQGAAAGVVFSEAVSAALLFRDLHRTIRIGRPERLAGLIAAVTVMTVIVVLLRGSGVAIPVAAGAVGYLVTLGLARGLTRDDLRSLRERF